MVDGGSEAGIDAVFTFGISLQEVVAPTDEGGEDVAIRIVHVFIDTLEDEAELFDFVLGSSKQSDDLVSFWNELDMLFSPFSSESRRPSAHVRFEDDGVDFVAGSEDYLVDVFELRNVPSRLGARVVAASSTVDYGSMVIEGQLDIVEGGFIADDEALESVTRSVCKFPFKWVSIMFASIA